MSNGVSLKASLELWDSTKLANAVVKLELTGLRCESVDVMKGILAERGATDLCEHVSSGYCHVMPAYVGA